MKNNIFSDQRLNYKDFFIILISWYFITLISYYINIKDFISLIYINDFLSFSIKVLAYIIFLVIIYSYFNLLYDLSLADLGFKFQKRKINFKALLSIFIILTAGVVLINLNYQPTAAGSFFPLSLSQNIFAVIYNDLPLLVLTFISLLFIAAVEQFLFNKVVFALFDLYLPTAAAVIFSALFVPVLFLEFNSAAILIIFISVLISNFLYILSDYNLLTPILFYSYFLTLYIAFIYGFDFIII